MPYKFIGRKTDFKGKTLWELLSNLKNFGVGRLVIRQRFQRYPEPCFFKILKVAALPTPPKTELKLNMYNKIEDRKCQVLCEHTFRGQKSEELIELLNVTYKADYQLVPKDEEHKYLNCKPRDVVILPRTMEFPPLLREVIKRNMRAKGIPITQEPTMEMVYNLTGHKRTRVAKEGETPTVTFQIGLGTPANPKFYENLKPIE